MRTVYKFNRGTFGRWGIPMWAGETRAFRLIRLLVKQGIKGILYEEGSLKPYSWGEQSRSRRRPDMPRYRGINSYSEFDKYLSGEAPTFFKVSFTVKGDRT